MTLEVRGVRRDGAAQYAVYNEDGERVSAIYDTDMKAQVRIKQLRHSEKLRRQKTDRACMCCGLTFRSAHKFNRLCDHCRRGNPRNHW